MKKITFQTTSLSNHGTEEEPVMKQTFYWQTLFSRVEDFGSDLERVREVAVEGTITVEDIPESPEEQIAKLKAQLESTDYKIIKCSEAQLMGEELPYDIAALHAERQTLRDRINELESGGGVMTE